ncbi:ABC transporter permease [Rudanella lutea]|uniref:ABC transporter permease n=1 Tax=Rudanella lutea TaxID=451374 RepID=UPI0003719CA2|nr:ABC transporter permease [Rudanella lutea]
MIRHLFKLIWNKKKAHTLLIIEIWASFLVLFGLSSLIVFNVSNYNQPLGFAYENVWAIDLRNNQDTVAVTGKTQAIMQRIRSYPEVQSASRMSSNYPFSANTMNNNVTHDKATTLAYFFVTDGDFAKTLQMPLTAGRWYTPADSVGKFRPAVINQLAKDELFGDEDPLGKVITSGDGRYKVVGVVNTFKSKGEFQGDKPTIFEQLNENTPWDKTVLIRIKPGTDAVFEAKLVKDITSMAPEWGAEITYLTDSRQNQHNLALVPVTIFLIVCGFLLINVALGLFGILNVSIAKRRGEIGLRRALGATESGISWHFVGEMWVLATFAVVLGLVLAGQFPLMNVFDLDTGVYLKAILISVVVVYAIVTLCAVYPSRQAATVQPAVALHEE